MVVVVWGVEFIPVVAVLDEKGEAIVVLIEDDVKGVKLLLISCYCSTVCIRSLVTSS